MLYGVILFQIYSCIFFLDANLFPYINGANVDIYNFNVIRRYRRQIQNTICSITQFKCDSGQCIDDIELCDGKADCNDNSDENLKVCYLEKCPNISFMCDYGACIHMNGRCNGVRDCFDGSDEKSCPYAVAKNVTSSNFKGCLHPNNPLHGKYDVLNHLSVEYTSNPGDIVPVFSKLFLNCDKGFVINPPEDDGLSYCLPTKEWSPASKICTRMSLFSAGCRLPNNPSHGKYVVINYLSARYIPGDIVPVYGLLYVQCNSGYVINPLENDQPSYCLPSEEWSSAPKTCTLMQFVRKGCQVPNNPLYGEYVVNNNLSSNGYKMGDIVPTYSLLSVHCNTTYTFNPTADEELSNCLPTGEWHPAPKKCENPEFPKEGCIFPYINPLHGKYTVSNHSSEYKPGDIIPINELLFLNCNTEYGIILRLDEKPSICLPTGDWSPALYDCPITQISSKGCILPINPLHGTYIVEYPSSLYLPGDLVPETALLSVNCNKGFEVDPTPKDKLFTCLRGKWSSTLKTCTIRSPSSNKRCQVPSNPPHGTYNVINDFSLKYKSGVLVQPQTLLSVNCTTGYAANPPENNTVFFCGYAGEWIPSVNIITCSRACPSLTSTNTTIVECEFDGKPLNTCLNAGENTIARISCISRYEEQSIEQYPTRLCKDGSWRYPIPQCYPFSHYFTNDMGQAYGQTYAQANLFIAPDPIQTEDQLWSDDDENWTDDE